MFKRKLNNSSGGFTIVEVMIVLAIAGLVIAIVFIAVPALRRSSNNSGRSADVGQLTTAISNYTANRNGQLPATLQAVTHVSGSELGWAYYEFAPLPAAVTGVTTAQAGTVGSAPAHCPPPGNPSSANSAACTTSGGTWVAAVTSVDDTHRLSYIATTSGVGIPAADALNKALPSPDEIHVWSGYKCPNGNLANGNPKAVGTAATRYTATDITKASRRDVAIVYQLEGEATALCIDDI